MFKLSFLISLIISAILFLPKVALAESLNNNYVTVINPVRGSEFWDDKVITPSQAVITEQSTVKQLSVPATWLFRYDALIDPAITQNFTQVNNLSENGLLLEVTPDLTKAANVPYHTSQYWHDAGSVFLTGYSPDDRKKLIDESFKKFHDVFGSYPKSVGAWWIDSDSLSYMQDKYGISSSLEVADQYSTDNYQIWGQFWGTPYYPARGDALRPAQTTSEKLPIVMMQWATRDPVNGYGNGVMESTYSLQANDYLDYHNLTTDYFGKLVDLYMTQKFNQFNQISVGLENSYTGSKYQGEYRQQLQSLLQKQSTGELHLTTMMGFSNWYQSAFKALSPTQTIVASDPLGTNRKSVWFMDPYYRANWFYDETGTSSLRDVRQYVEGDQELCLKTSCESINFATSATRVLDNVSFGQSFFLDRGQIENWLVNQKNSNTVISYLNEGGSNRQISFLNRDIKIDDQPSSIDSLILKAQSKPPTDHRYELYADKTRAQGEMNLGQLFINFIKFSLFVIFCLTLPGLAIVKSIKDSKMSRVFLGISLGFVASTLFFYIAGWLHNYWLALIPIGFLDLVAIKYKLYKVLKPTWTINRQSIILTLTVIAGTIFQTLPTLQSGWITKFGMGFWGPNGHDGIWHMALVNQLIQGLPPENPAFSGVTLKNYHYLYDLLIGATSFVTQVPVTDLIFRFYPILLSLLLGIGTYLLAKRLFKSDFAAIGAVYFSYFSGSFGWIVSYIKDRAIAGESAFWANQTSSFNLNPPFAISIILVIALLYLLTLVDFRKFSSLTILIGLIAGSLIGFKSYAAILMFGALGLTGLFSVIKYKQLSLWFSLCVAGIVGLAIYLPNFTGATQIFIWSPFWLIHTMIDFSDRIGWERLSIGRMAYIERGDWLKFFGVEIIGLFIFIFGNLGMRIMSFWLIFKYRSIFKETVYLFMAIFSLLALIIPLLFVQAGTAWNIVQFFYYFLYIAGLLAGLGLWYFFKSSPRKIKYLFLLIVLVLVLTPLNSIVTVNSYLTRSPHAFISPSELNSLTYLSTLPKGTVLTYPYDKNSKSNLSDPRPLFAYETTAYVSAISKKPTFVEDEIQQDILQTPYLKRIAQSQDFFTKQDPSQSDQLIKDNNIKYIYLPKFYNINLDVQKLNLKNIYENDWATVYETD